MNLRSGSTTSTRSLKLEEIGTRSVQSGKKNVKSTVLVLGGVGAHKVNCGLRSGAETTPDAPYRARGCVKLDKPFLVPTVVSYKDCMECFTTRNTKSATSGCASTIQGNFDSKAIAGLKAPREKRAFKSPSFWFGISLGSEAFLASFDGEGRIFELPLDSRGAAIASWLTFASEMRLSTEARYFLCRSFIPASVGVI